MRLTTLFALILCNLVWAANPTVGKILLRDFSPAHMAWLRYSSALASYFLFFRLRGFPLPMMKPQKKEWGWILFLGFATFCFSPLTQSTGLASSTATDNALIIAMEPLVTLVLAALLLRERLKTIHLAAFAVALFGFSLLTGLTPTRWLGGLDTRLSGNLLILAAIMGEALFSVLGRKLTIKHPSAAVFGTALTVGVAILTIAVFLTAGLPPFARLSWQDLAAILWLGPLGTTATYLFWMIALQTVSIPAMTLTLFVQPLFGSFLGYIYLHERLNGLQTLGGGLILLGILICTIGEASAASHVPE